ncbi:MAG: gliding motility-associated C-terminal domain-containing protein [Prevotellaceae bacterium]|jgi:uncharacterized repeat protein (TIGR01451 family)/gliding motility-associated-like protein|nr:gliding motility-associated C-terminal domain-containing protein [Prevotellaceae bacterium]
MASVFSQAQKKRKSLTATLAQLFFVPFAFAGEVVFSYTADKTVARQGEELTYSVSVHNCAASAAGNMLIVDSIPKGLTLLSCSADDYRLSNRSLLVRIARLPAGEEFSFDVTVRVDRKGTLAKTLLLRENGVTIKTLQHKICALSKNVLTGKVSMFTLSCDGANGYFEIPGLLSYPNNELIVFNRYSDKVYQKRNYANDWNGSNLPAGNYYYLLTIYLDNSVVQKYNGAIAIKRQP